MTNIKHAPLPYESNGQGLIYGQVSGDNDEAPLICDCQDTSLSLERERANEAFIILACNSYYPMLEALTLLREDMDMLRSGDWIPDNDSCEASVEIASRAINTATKEGG